MQVSQTQDYITHAQLGVGKTQSFKMAETAEFFQVLSSSLYSNKKLAVIRETLCNAWDAHIAAGCTDVPVQVTLTDEFLIIRDFGKGIDPVQIVPIYGTYGASTKVHDGKQTGGFGLGCKAPFAYNDHFEVTSFHAGTKTIYSMSLSSPEMNGLPAITTILTLPTDETGLQVKIGLKSLGDQRDFERLIRDIARHGEMTLEFNGTMVDTIPYSMCEQGFAALPRDGYLSAGLHVRYGNVVYQVASHADFGDEYDWFNGFLRKAFSYNSFFGDRALVLLAEPHSIAVTPSRESLSMNDRTIANIKAMLVACRKAIEAETHNLAAHLLNTGIEDFWRRDSFHRLFHFNRHNPEFPGRWDRAEIFVGTAHSPKALARAHVRNYYRYSSDLQALDLRLRLEALIRSKQDKTGLARKLRLTVKKHSLHQATDWFQQELVQPLWKGMVKHPLLDHRRLIVFKDGYDRQTNCIQLDKMDCLSAVEALPFVRGHVFLSYNRLDVLLRGSDHPAMKHHFGRSANSLVYTVQRKPEHIEAAKAFFEQRGFYVVDLTRRYSWDTIEVRTERAKPKPKLQSQPGFASIINEHGAFRWLEHLAPEELAKFPGSDEPAFYTMATNSSVVVDGIRPFRGQLTRINRLYGDRGVVAITPAQRDKLTKAKLPSLHVWLPQQLVREFKADPTLRRAWSCNVDRKGLSTETWDLVKRISIDAVLGPKFKLKVELNERQQEVMTLAEYVLNECNVGDVLGSYLRKLKDNPNLTRLIKQVKASDTFKLINTYQLISWIGPTETGGLSDKARQLILHALKG